MNYGYIRVSTEKQSIENQKYSIISYSQKQDLEIDKWVSETISGKSSLTERSLGRLLKRLSWRCNYCHRALKIREKFAANYEHTTLLHGA